MHPLIRQLGAVRRRVRWLLLLHALAWMTAAVLAVGVLLGGLDYLLHFEDRGIRIMASLAVLVTAIYFAWRLLWPAISTRLSDVGLALRVEERFPKLRDQLASTVQFLRQRSDDDEAGSAMLRREVIHQTAADIEHVDMREAVDLRPALRAAGVACIGIAVLAGLSLAAPEVLATAVVRLAAPFGDAAWPKVHHLKIVNPVHRLALNERFEVEVADALGARLPPEVRIHYRYTGDAAAGQERSELMRPARGLMLASIDNVTRPFQYRVEGGDDDSMPWQDLEVVEPPAVEQLNIEMRYPAYTGWPPSTVEAQLRALVGTRVGLSGRTNKSLSSATLKIDDETEIVATIGRDGTSFTIPVEAETGFVVRKSGFFTLDLVDHEGFHGGKDVRYEIRAIEDRPPSITFEEPSADIYVTADAVVPLRFSAKDDLALKRADLHWSKGEAAEQAAQTLPLYEGPESVAVGADTSAESSRGESRTIEYRWNLADLGLKTGDRLSVIASVSDYQPVVAKSHARRLSIITRDELQDRLTERQGAIISELGRLLKLEQQSRAQVGGAEIQLDQVGKLSKQDIDHLQQAELTQRQVERGIGRRDEGVPAQIEALLNELKNNRVDSNDVERRLSEVRDELNRIGREHLPNVGRELTSALKNAQAQPADNSGPDRPNPNEPAPSEPKTDNEQPSPANTAKSLAAAGKDQDATIESLEQLLNNLTEWDSYRRFHRDIGQLKREQEEVARDTAEQGNKTLTQDVKELKPQQQADLRKLGSRQADLGRNFERVQQRMQQMAEQLRESDPLAADTISDALHQALERTLAGQMRDTGRSLEQNQLGEASAQQQQIMKGLDELLDILSNRRERELGRLVKKLKEAEQQMQQMRKEQAGLKKKLDDAAKIADEKERKRELERLAREQKKLEEEAQRFARQLKRLQADQAGRTAGRAAGKMGAAGEKGEQGDAGGAAEQAEQAQKDLEDAQQQLAETRKKAESDLANEQVARMEDTVKALVQQQEKLIAETKHYDDLAKKDGGLRRSQLLSLRDVARHQRNLSGEVGGIAEKLAAGAGAFELAFKAIGRSMSRAADGLDQHDTSDNTQLRQRQAIEQLAQLMKAFEPGKKKPKEKKEGGEQGGGEGGQQGGGPPSPAIAELRLVKLMQEGINARVRDLFEESQNGRNLTPDEQQEYAELSQQQGELADLLLNMSKPEPEAEKDDLKKLLDPDAEGKKERE